jgi:hypothetical protein
MSLLTSVGPLPNDIMMQVVNFLDARSKANFSRACKCFRQNIENTGISLSMLGFASYLIDEMIIAGMYKRALNRAWSDAKIKKTLSNAQLRSQKRNA